MSAPTLWAILVAGGSGVRYGQGASKLLEPLLPGTTVLEASFGVLQGIPNLSGTVVVSHPDWQAEYQQGIERYHPRKPVLWATGGATRRESVWKGLLMVPKEIDIVLIHDAARPLVTLDRIMAALDPVVQGHALGTSLGVPAQNSLKQVSSGETPWVEKTLERTHLWQVHTPQIFRRGILEAAHQQIPTDLAINDDAELVERTHPEGNAVLMVMDRGTNIKITTPTDLQIARAILTQTSSNPVKASPL